MKMDKGAAAKEWREKFNNRSVSTPKASGFEVKNVSADTSEIYIYDDIGYFGITAKDFTKQLNTVTAPNIVVHINSGGGDVFDGLAIYSALQSHPSTITTVVDGLAASAASFIALAGDTVTMSPNSFMMIHKAWAMGIGNADDMTALAGVLGKIDGQIAGMYSAKNGKSAEDNLAAMAAETWMTSAEAKDFGLVDSIVGDEPAEDEAASAAVTKAARMRMRLGLSEIK